MLGGSEEEACKRRGLLRYIESLASYSVNARFYISVGVGAEQRRTNSKTRKETVVCNQGIMTIVK